MITENTTTTIAPYLAALDTAGVALEVISGTPLAALGAASSESLCLPVGNREASLSLRSLSLYSNNEQYGGTMSAAVSAIAPAIKEHIRVAQSVVNPVVLELVDRVEEISKYFVSTAVSSLRVERMTLPLPLQIVNLKKVIEAFCPSETIYINPVRIFPQQTDEQLLELMKVGNADVDAEISKWFYAQPANFFKKVWQSFFLTTKANFLPGNNYSMDTVQWTTKEGTSVALALFMLCNRMHDNPIDGLDSTMGHTVRSCNGFLADLRAQASRRLVDTMDMQAEYKSSGSLVRRVDSVAKTIYVNDEVYLKWLDKSDGSNEILYGLMITGDKVTMTQEIDERKARYLQAYHDYTQLAKEVSMNDWRTNMHRTLIDCLSELISKSDLSSNAKTIAYSSVNNTVFALPEPRMRDDLYDVCLELVHQYMFPGTASIVILRGINTAKEKNNDLSVREAATVSILRYIVTYVASLIKVSPAASGAI